MSYMHFYIPCLFRMRTRENGKIKLLPFLLTDFLPVLFFMQNYRDVFRIHNFAVFLAAYIAMFDFYELGYIVNDCITVRREEKPTMRMSAGELRYFDNQALKIFGVRFFIYAVFLVCLAVQGYCLNAFCVGNILLLVAYCAHNHLRGKINILTNAFLNFAKYLIPFLVLPLTSLASNSLPLIFYSILFPFGRSLFYAVGKIRESANRDAIWFLWFAAGCAFSAFVRCFSIMEISGVSVIYVAVFAIYRLGVFLLKMKRRRETDGTEKIDIEGGGYSMSLYLSEAAA